MTGSGQSKGQEETWGSEERREGGSHGENWLHTTMGDRRLPQAQLMEEPSEGPCMTEQQYVSRSVAVKGKKTVGVKERTGKA